MYVCACMQKKVSEFTYLFISCPQRTWYFQEVAPLLLVFILILLLDEGATRANNIALFANQLMLEFIRSFHFPFAFTARYLKLGTPSHMAFSVVQGKFLLTPATLALL